MIKIALKKKRGQAIVEMAFVFPFILMIVVGGLIDFGFAFYNMLTLQQIANDTVQWAAAAPPGRTSSEITLKAREFLPAWWDSTKFSVVRVRKVRTPDNGADVIQVFLRYDSATYTPFYQTMLNLSTGDGRIPLAVVAAYQIPEVVFTR